MEKKKQFKRVQLKVDRTTSKMLFLFPPIFSPCKYEVHFVIFDRKIFEIGFSNFLQFFFFFLFVWYLYFNCPEKSKMFEQEINHTIKAVLFSFPPPILSTILVGVWCMPFGIWILLHFCAFFFYTICHRKTFFIDFARWRKNKKQK